MTFNCRLQYDECDVVYPIRKQKLSKNHQPDSDNVGWNVLVPLSVLRHSSLPQHGCSLEGWQPEWTHQDCHCSGAHETLDITPDGWETPTPKVYWEGNDKYRVDCSNMIDVGVTFFSWFRILSA